MNRRQLTLLLLALFASLANAGPARADTVLRIVMNSDLKIIDPVWSAAYVVREHSYMISDTLLLMRTARAGPNLVRTDEAR